MDIQPIGNRLVVKLIKKEQTSASGIIISTEEKNEQAKGEIVAIADGVGTIENIKDLGLKKGQIVLFGKFAGEEVEGEEAGIMYKILSGKDVLAIIK
jgi:chaperonin GroES